ncbi:MAG: T9SS type A sorting domain-containing protein [Saprospiraceae bacterium]|nr:T9SS type A sorting domain-containing protein [Saprospiraceae bacterium]
MKLFLSWVIFALTFVNYLSGQRNCGAMEVLDRQIKENPALLQKMNEVEKEIQDYIRKNPNGSGERFVITIPTVVHVLYRTSSENISDAQIQSQLDVMNFDFSATNSDVSLTPALFSGVVANAEVQFCLAKQTPTGGATTGINRKSTTLSSWGTNDNVKRAAQGGIDPWNANNYLNLWVCNIGGGILGYAQFPGGSLATDGVVIDYRYFGTIGTATAPFNKGRTATHEVGHWLNLRHIWGDANCGSDLVSDTPVHNTSNFGCPASGHLSTCTGSPVEMTMNYMDYTDDACMYMFSSGQKIRMRTVLEGNGSRASLQNSPGCMAPSGGGSCAAPAGLSVSGITTSAANCSWSAVSGAVNYTFEYKLNTSSTWTVQTLTGTSVSLSGLTAGTLYNTRVKTTCGTTSSAYSTTVNFTTLSTSGCTDNFESNNTKNTSAQILIGALNSAKISSASDVDWFKFSNISTQRNVKVTMTNLPADYDMVLYRTNNQVGISENANQLDEQIIYNNSQSAATYYVKVYGYNGVFNNSLCYALQAQISSSGFRSDGSNELIQGELVKNEFLVFPNPAGDVVTMVMPFGQTTEGVLTVMDVTGKVVATQKMFGDKYATTFTMDVSQFDTGLYLLNFRTENESYSQKLAISGRR